MTNQPLNDIFFRMRSYTKIPFNLNFKYLQNDKKKVSKSKMQSDKKSLLIFKPLLRTPDVCFLPNLIKTFYKRDDNGLVCFQSSSV